MYVCVNVKVGFVLFIYVILFLIYVYNSIEVII